MSLLKGSRFLDQGLGIGRQTVMMQSHKLAGRQREMPIEAVLLEGWGNRVDMGILPSGSSSNLLPYELVVEVDSVAIKLTRFYWYG